MCYLPPGPRCSQHASQELLLAITATQGRHSVSKKMVLADRLTQATRVYHSTPRGQRELKREIAALVEAAKTDDEKASKLSDLKLQLNEGMITRKNQIIAYEVAQENKKDDLKLALGTRSKQQLAVGIAFHELMKVIENTSMEAHITDDDTISLYGNNGSLITKVLCLPHKHQSVFATLTIEDGKLVLPQPASTEVENVLNSYTQTQSTSKESLDLLKKWVVGKLESDNVGFVAHVDVRTENTNITDVKTAFDLYNMSFKKKLKLGGTSSYRHGQTDELEEALAGTRFVSAEVRKTDNRTYLFNVPYADRDDLHVGQFYLAQHPLEGNQFYYEVRSRHVPKQMNLFIVLKRHAQVITTTNIVVMEEFISSVTE
jgi:hypothetical protein